MLRQTTRKYAIIATVVLTCVVGAACGSTGSAGNDVAATRAVVTTAAEKTEATTTTTTTAATTTAEPETSTKLETSTESKAETTESATETIESSATETTESEATTTEEPKETTIEPMEDNPDGMYPAIECFRRKVEELSNSKVESIDFDEELKSYTARTIRGEKYLLGIDLALVDSNELLNIEKFNFSNMVIYGYDVVILYEA